MGFKIVISIQTKIRTKSYLLMKILIKHNFCTQSRIISKFAIKNEMK